MLSQIFKILLVCLFIIIVGSIPSKTASALQIEQHAHTILNCTNEGFWGNKTCFQNLQIDNSKENNKSWYTNPIESELNKETQKTASQPKQQKTSQLNDFFLGGIGIGGVIIAIGGVKRLFSANEVKKLKERIEILETIATRE